jgi:hypothetical protein
VFGSLTQQETMMNMQIGKGVLCAAALAGLFAATGATAARNDGMDTCVNTFIAQELPQGHPVKIVKRERREMYMSFRPTTKIMLQTKGKRTGQSYGSATCLVDRNGGLLAMQVEAPRIRVAKSEATERSTGG